MGLGKSFIPLKYSDQNCGHNSSFPVVNNFVILGIWTWANGTVVVGEFENNESKGSRTIYMPGDGNTIWNQVRVGPGMPIWEQTVVTKPEEAWFAHKMPAAVALKR